MRLDENKRFEDLPKSKNVKEFVLEVKKYIFLGYFEKIEGDLSLYKDKLITRIKELYLKNVSSEHFDDFLKSLDDIEHNLALDLDYFYESDPACESKEEIVLTYPGYKAIINYRIAHSLYKLGIRIVPRLISEIAHSKTGIDIHPGATIDAPFFIDHGTGIVIGETAEVGKCVKLYQGVTLGALSLRKGRNLSGTKRHPTIKDYVTIYSGSSILGGDTIIGERVTIGSNVFIVNSVLNDTKVIYRENKIRYIE